MNRATFIAAATALISLAVLPAHAQDSQKLVITGASTIAPLALEIGKRFEKLVKLLLR